jgi:hypothetical protein
MLLESSVDVALVWSPHGGCPEFEIHWDDGWVAMLAAVRRINLNGKP